MVTKEKAAERQARATAVEVEAETVDQTRFGARGESTSSERLWDLGLKWRWQRQRRSNSGRLGETSGVGDISGGGLEDPTQGRKHR